MRSRRSLDTRGSRRGTILVLAAAAFLLQGVHLVGIPRWPAAAPAETAAPAVPAGSPASPRGGGSPGNPGPTLTVPPPPGVPIPEGAVLLYESTGSPAAPGGRRLNPPELLRGLILMHEQGRLELTPRQARELHEAVQGLGEAYGGMRTARDEMLQTLTPEQLQWLEEHPPAAGEIPSGAPEQNAEAPARRVLESLDR